MSSRGGMFKRGRRGDQKRHHDRGDPQKTQKKDTAKVDESSPVIQAFLQFREQLDAKHDKYERLVKLSRDVTIDSKRTIFLLHRISGDNKSEILTEAEEKLQEIRQNRWRAIAKELHNEDPYQYLRAVSPGLQEYVEACSFHYYLQHNDLISLEQVEKGLRFAPEKAPDPGTPEEPKSTNVDAKENSPVISENPASEAKSQSPENNSSKPSDSGTVSHIQTDGDIHQVELSVHVPPMEYMLGIADLTGELMRKAISSVGSGDLNMPAELCRFISLIHNAFVSYGNVCRELPRKLSVLKQSLKKVENACYTLQVRGSEIPKHMLADVFTNEQTDKGFPDDEGGHMYDD